MSRCLEPDPEDRLLIVVPHPDDETLATGGLIQLALAAGAQLRVVIVTDGDNNPWPQRWIERRWQIGADARRRWGSRRRGEAFAALARLGVGELDCRFYGWPDQGLTAELMRDSQCEDRLANEIADFAPSLVVAPGLADLHPDHSALRVMLELALAKTVHGGSLRAGFIVHGSATGVDLHRIGVSREQQQTKQAALLAHASQLVLSRRRMTRLCERIEQFEIEGAPGGGHRASASGSEWRARLPAPGRRLRRHALCLVARVEDVVIRARLRLPRGWAGSSLEVALDDPASTRLRIRAKAGEVTVALSSDQPVQLAFAKIERLGSRILIYDRAGWMRLAR